jgi:hypothetical protein
MFIGRTILVFLLLFIGLRHLYPEGILIYQGIAVGAVVSICQALLARVQTIQSWRETAKDGLIAFLLIYSFVFTFPTTVDRSFSVKMLLYFDNSPQGLNREDISRFYVTNFVTDGGVDKRLTEQRATGTLVEQDGRYFLTPIGKALDVVFRITCRVFACQ